jgi:polyferredoxin
VEEFKLVTSIFIVLYPGQRGCEQDDQCSLQCPGATCNQGYCVCPRHQLIHQSRCTNFCPDGFINVAARCHDITTVLFMDSVDGVFI